MPNLLDRESATLLSSDLQHLPLKICLIEDDKVDRMAITRYLKGLQDKIEIIEAVDLATGISLFNKEKFDFILLDYRLPDGNAEIFLKHVTDNFIVNPPVIVLTVIKDEDLAMKLIESGAQDYLIKDSITPITLRRSINYALARQVIAEDLAKEKEHLAVTLKSIGDGVITTDCNSNIVLMNEVAEKITGWTLSQARGKSFNKVFQIFNEKTRIPVESPVDKVLKAGKIVELANDTVLITKNSGERIIADSGAPVRTRDGTIIGVVFVFRDVTEQRKIDFELQNIQKLESLGVFAGGIAHDFNNLLQGITGNISLAKVIISRMKGGEEVIEILSRAENISERAQSIAQQLLTFAEGGEPIKEIVNLGKFVINSVDLVVHGSKSKCQFTLSDDLWTVEVDQGQFAQVIHNLVLNASQAMPEGGTIEVSAENFVKDNSIQMNLEQGNYVVIKIKDAGIGILDKHVETIFDPFFTTKNTGSGLGLAISHGVIAKHNGCITVESHVGVGTTFAIYLPASDKQVVSISEIEDQVAKLDSKILVMDDEEYIREFVVDALTNLGCRRVETAKDGKQAIELFKKAKDSGEPYDLVILDMTIPGGMDGKSTIQELIKIDGDIKAIVSSGYSKDPVMSNFQEHGFCASISKPYNISRLSTLIADLLTKET